MLFKSTLSAGRRTLAPGFIGFYGIPGKHCSQPVRYRSNHWRYTKTNIRIKNYRIRQKKFTFRIYIYIE